MRSPSIRLLASVVCACAIGCGKSAGGHTDGGVGVDAAPLPGTRGSWTWVDVPGMGCDDGSGTGVAATPAPAGAAGDTLFLYFMGGGACWDVCNCLVLTNAVPGTLGQS